MAAETITLDGPVVLLGGDTHIHAARRLREAYPGIDWRAGGDAPGILLADDPALPEGAFRITTDAVARRTTIAGGPFSGVIFGTEELLLRGGADPARIELPADPVAQAPGLVYRTFWTWDHSTDWELSQVGHQEIGVFNPYGKPPGGFLADYRRCVDFCSRNRIVAIVIYGFLRDSHGGIEAAQELCRYATERGVRIGESTSA